MVESAMVELKESLRSLKESSGGLGYTVRFVGVTEKMFAEMVDEDTDAELIDGVMVVHSPASPHHDNIAGFVRTLMRCFAEGEGLGLVLGPDSLVRLAPLRRFAPDLYFLDQERVPHPLPQEEYEGIPDLVLEVLSPSNRKEDLKEKRPAYQEAGVKEIWLIDPEEQKVIVDRRRGRRYTTTTMALGRVVSRAVPGFWIEAGWLWVDPLPNVMTCLREILGESP